MSLPPGTRIPEGVAEGMALHMLFGSHSRDRGYYRGLVEGLTLGAIAGGLVAMLCTALAWAHMGG